MEKVGVLGIRHSVSQGGGRKVGMEGSVSQVV